MEILDNLLQKDSLKTNK